MKKFGKTFTDKSLLVKSIGAVAYDLLIFIKRPYEKCPMFMDLHYLKLKNVNRYRRKNTSQASRIS